MSNSIELTIDGHKVEVPRGTSLYWAARKAGIEIPHICYGEDIPAMSACRVCVVEVEGMRNLAASCSHPAGEGMVVHTRSERAEHARRMNLELLLSDHNADCITCEKHGSCRLEKYAYQYGIRKPRMNGDSSGRPFLDEHPFIVRDYTKCILCGRCVYACNEIQYDNAININGRGFTATVGTSFNRMLDATTCTSCGRCISVCPVGALTEKNRVGQGREWELDTGTTVCGHCGCGCTLEIHTQNNTIARVTAPASGAVNNANLCIQGKFGRHSLPGPERVTQPLVRKDGVLTEVSWEEALSRAASGFMNIMDKYGSDSVGGLSCARCTNEENYVFQKFMRAGIGTNNLDHCARHAYAAGVRVLEEAWGSGAMPASIREIRLADSILVTGSAVTETVPILAMEIKAAVRKYDSRLVIVDSQKSDLGRFAYIWLQPRPGTEDQVFKGMMKVILDEKLVDDKFINSRTENFTSFTDSLTEFSPAAVEKSTGVLKEDIIQAARIFAEARHASILAGTGENLGGADPESMRCLTGLAMMTGNVGKKGTGVNILRKENNIQGTCDVGAFPSMLPGYQDAGSPDVRKKFETAWGRKLPSSPGLDLPGMIDAVGESNLHGMLVMEENPFLYSPCDGMTELRSVLSRLDFLVLLGSTLTDLADFADVVLPAECCAEKTGTYTSMERRVQLVRKIISSPEGVMSGFRIIGELSSRMGYSMDYSSTADIMDEIASLVPLYGGISHARLGKKGLQWPCPSPDHPGTPYLYGESFPSGKARFPGLNG